MSEIRVTDPKTGGAKGRKPEAYGLIPAVPLSHVAKLYAGKFVMLPDADSVSEFYANVEAFRGLHGGRVYLAAAAVCALELMTTRKLDSLDPIDGLAYSRIPVDSLAEVARAYHFGAYGKPSPYSAWNWLKGYSWELSFSALGRHAAKARSGVTHDDESGLNEWAHVVFHLFTLYEFERLGLGTDDRQPIPGPTPAEELNTDDIIDAGGL